MEKRLLCWSWMLWLCLSGSISAQESDWKKEGVVVCSEDAGWPPFSYSADGTAETFQGFNADLMKNIFDKNGINYRIVIRPWKRCLQDGAAGDVNIILDAAKNPEREQTYLLTEPVYSLTPVVFFPASDASQYPQPVSAPKLEAMLICGQKGYTYNNFGFDNDRVAMISKDLPKVLDLVLLKRCDLGLARKEILLSELTDYIGADKFAWQTLESVPPENFYWMLNRNFVYSSELKSIIDQEVAALYQSGAAQSMLSRYLK